MNLDQAINDFQASDKLTNERLLELDYLRSIACIAVIIIHISATGVSNYVHGSFPYILTLILNRSLGFATPLFVFLSGITNFYSLENKEIKYFEFVKKRLKSTLIPYVLWCVIYYIEFIYVGFYDFDIIFFIKRVFLGTMSYHFYFVIIIAQLYFLGPFIYKLIKNSKNRILLLLVAAAVTALCTEYIRFHLSDRIFIKYIFFYMLGICVTLEKDKFKSLLNKYKTIIVAGYIALSMFYTYAFYKNMFITTYVWFIFSVVSVFFIYCLSLLLKDKLNNVYGFIKLFGESSYNIYLMHPLVLAFMIKMAGRFGILSVTARLIIYFAVVILVTFTSCIVYTMIKNKVKKVRKDKKAVLAK